MHTFNKWIVFIDCSGVSDRQKPVSALIADGLTIDGQKFVLSERSASMTRNGILSFVSERVACELETRVRMDIDIQETVLSKYYAYRGLLLSSCHCIEGWLPKIVIIPDCTRTIYGQDIKCLYDSEVSFTDKDGNNRIWIQKNVKHDIRDIDINLFDGCGVHHPSITQYVKTQLRLQETPTTLLLRMPYIKGVTHEIDYVQFFAERGVAEITDIWGTKHSVRADAEPMFILTESMYKGYKYFKRDGTYSDWERYLDAFTKYEHCIGITKWNFSIEREPVYTRGNYQILQDLRLSYDEFASLATKSVQWAARIMDGDALYTYCLLGLTADKHKSINSYCKAILKNPELLNEYSVRKYVSRALMKYRNELKCGKLWLKGCFKFLAPDLVAFLEHAGGFPVVGCLRAGEFYCHDIDGDMRGERAVERNPHICESEHLILNAVVNDGTHWVEHLDNVCMVNGYDITPQRLQGADFDGDLVLVINDKTYMSGINREAIPIIDVDDKITVVPEKDTKENRASVILRTMKNMIGEYSNYASVYHNKTPKTDDIRARYTCYIDIISVTVGKSIDYAKTGVLFTIPKHIAKYGRPLPYFMKYRGAYYARQKLSKSQSNMNRLCFDMERWDNRQKWKRASGKFDYTLMIDDEHTYDEAAFEKVREIFLSYLKECKELNAFQAMCKNYDEYADELDGISKADARAFVVDWGYYYEKYKTLCAEVCPDQQALANICVRICYENYPKRDKKFIWIVAEEGVLANINQVTHALPVRTTEETRFEYLGKYYNWETYDGRNEIDQ